MQNQARPLHSMPISFKIPTPIFTIFATVERRDILNMPIIQQFVYTSSAKHVMINLKIILLNYTKISRL